MALRKLQIAGAPFGRSAHPALQALGLDGSGASRREPGRDALLYGGVALGLVAGAAISAYLWKQRAHALNLLQATPFERAEELIASCEHKIEDIERAIDELKNAAR